MLLQEILKERPYFSNAESTIADYILARGEEIKNESARQIAARAYTSPSSVVRLCQKIGYKGYNEFRDAWLAELRYLSRDFQGVDANRPFEKGDPVQTIAGKLNRLYQETLDDTLSLLGTEQLERAVQYCSQAEHIYICAGGAQSAIAKSFMEKMLKIGKVVLSDERGDIQFYQASICAPSDCFILISYSGETKVTLRVAKKLKERGIHTVVITAYGGNSLAAMFPCVLYVSTRERLIKNAGTFAPHLTTLYLLDVLYAGVFARQFDACMEEKLRLSREYEIERRSYTPLLREE